MPVIVEIRWTVRVIKPDGSAGVGFHCVSPNQRALVCLVLTAAAVSYTVEEFRV